MFFFADNATAAAVVILIARSKRLKRILSVKVKSQVTIKVSAYNMVRSWALILIPANNKLMSRQSKNEKVSEIIKDDFIKAIPLRSPIEGTKFIFMIFRKLIYEV